MRVIRDQTGAQKALGYVVEIDEGAARVYLDIDHRHINRGDSLHGGIIAPSSWQRATPRPPGSCARRDPEPGVLSQHDSAGRQVGALKRIVLQQRRSIQIRVIHQR